ncbi:MAG: stage V sporulation T C-terminal domain-containing protein [Bacilli bacterium]|nr:stage V sporulation T C-terminal domain-containing protein [Bacilli bacterium]MDD4607576.1 stage V sporulation T C-terminal domain-containing protein [Bacilli bacterium]
MKTTGIIRRIDELGRIVIPKEIRKNLRIKDGENLEICIEDKNIILRKYSLMKKIDDLGQSFTDTIYAYLKKDVMITNRDKVIAISGNLKKEYLNKDISEEMDECINRRESILEKYPKKIEIIDGVKVEGTYALSTVSVNGDSAGLVIVFDKENNIDEVDYKVIQIVANFLSKYLEE